MCQRGANRNPWGLSNGPIPDTDVPLYHRDWWSKSPPFKLQANDQGKGQESTYENIFAGCEAINRTASAKTPSE